MDQQHHQQQHRPTATNHDTITHPDSAEQVDNQTGAGRFNMLPAISVQQPTATTVQQLPSFPTLFPPNAPTGIPMTQCFPSQKHTDSSLSSQPSAQQQQQQFFALPPQQDIRSTNSKSSSSHSASSHATSNTGLLTLADSISMTESSSVSASTASSETNSQGPTPTPSLQESSAIPLAPVPGRKERNRIAALRYRERQNKYRMSLEGHIKSLEQENEKLRQQRENLRNLNFNLCRLLEQSSKSGCRIPSSSRQGQPTLTGSSNQTASG